MRAISINLRVKFSTVNMKQIQSSRSSICSTGLRGAHLERIWSACYFYTHEQHFLKSHYTIKATTLTTQQINEVT